MEEVTWHKMGERFLKSKINNQHITLVTNFFHGHGKKEGCIMEKMFLFLKNYGFLKFC